MPTVSVIIPNFNHARFLRQRIDSVLNQTFQDFEVIILDDCSTDDSREIIESYRNNEKLTHIIYNERNSGSPFKQWQKGMELAAGEYIWIAESDDWCEDNLMETLLAQFSKKKKVGLSYCKSFRMDSNGNFMDDLSFWYQGFPTGRWDRPYMNHGKNEIVNYLSNRNTIPNASAVLFKKKLVSFNMAKLYNFWLCGDWYFWIRLLERTDIAYSSKQLNFFRTHSETVRNSEKGIQEYEKEKALISNYLVSKGLNKKASYKSRLKNKIKPVGKVIKKVFGN